MSLTFNPFERSVINDYFLEHGYQSQGYFRARAGLLIPNEYVCTFAYENVYTNADAYAYADTIADANTDAYAYADTDADANADADADTDADANAEGV